MPPRLAHKKTRSGCKRCKARKVKCDEAKPNCTACTRHGVSCEYPGSVYGDHRSPSTEISADHIAEHEMELRLLHEWMAYTSETLTTTVDFWKVRAPLLALQNRFVFEALLALAALHASRQEARVWSGLHGREVPVGQSSTPTGEEPPGAPVTNEWKGWKAFQRDKYPTESSSALIGTPESRRHMLEVSRKYFSRALEGQQRAIASMGSHTIQSSFLCSILVNFYSMFTLSESDDDANGNPVGIMNWIRLSRGIRNIMHQMAHLSVESLQVESMHGEPDLSDADELFHPIHMEPFKYLLSNVDGDEIVEEDRIAYEHTVSFVGLIYKGIVQNLDSTLASGRRCNAMPASVPLRFLDLVEANRPRAMAIMAHTFASMHLIQDRYPWFKGIGEYQIPIIYRSLPQQWVEFVQWPMQVVQGVVANGSQQIMSPSNGMQM